MRIRKHASKLLGSASVFPSPPPPPPAANPCSSPAHGSVASAEILCELNCSPWDVMLPNLHHTNPKEEDDVGGIMGNCFIAEEEPIAAITSTAAELTIEEIGEERGKDVVERQEKKVKKRRKRREIEIKTSAASAGEIIPNCKKSDGKGWQCKRPARPQHSLCDYHLTQLRSYNSNHSHKVSDAAAGIHGTNHHHHHHHHRAKAAGGGGSNFCYYYYSGFGPWRGKKRGGGYVNGGVGDARVKEERRETSSRSEDGYNATIVHDDMETDDDLYDLDEEEDDDDDDSVEEGEKGRLLKKRGRKPVKARSLKSLL